MHLQGFIKCSVLRTSCGQERLNGLTLLNMYPEVKIDLNEIIDRFARSGMRRLEFMHPNVVTEPCLY